jgi:uncharacterized protein involved in outer membrane biogenesis
MSNASPTTDSFIRKHRRVFQWAGGVLVVYSLLGFFALPWFVKGQLIGLLEERLDLSAEIDSIRFNPYSMAAAIDGMRVVDSGGSDLISLEHFGADLSFIRLLLLQVSLSGIELSGLNVFVERESESSNTVTDLVSRWQATAAVETTASLETESEQSDEPFPFRVEQVQLNRLRIQAVDQVPEGSFTGSLSVDNAEIANLSTLPGELASHNLSLTVNDTASMEITGGLGLNPVSLHGSVALDGLTLDDFSPYVTSIIPMVINRGELGLGLSYQLDLSDPEPGIEISDGSLTLLSLALAAGPTQQGFLSLESLNLDGLTVNVPNESVRASTLQLAGLELAVERDEDGSIDLQRLFMGESSQMPTTPQQSIPNEANSAATTWSVSLGQFDLDDSRVDFSDRALRSDYTVAAGVDLSV